MCDDWMPTIRLRLTPEQFQQLPRHAAYKYEYLGGDALLSPRARHYHALLHLTPSTVECDVPLRPARADDFTNLITLFAETFREIQPFGSLDDATRLLAARQTLERTRTGGDGPWIEPASFVVEGNGSPAGAIFITLLPPGDPNDWDNYRWQEPPPADAINRCLGRPHLTWILIDPVCAGQGLGTALLATATNALLALGFHDLASTFMVGNTSSTHWHWRNGFELLSHPNSYRRARRAFRGLK
jgi:hypothetical protein